MNTKITNLVQNKLYMAKYFSVLHSANIGDLIASLSGIRAVWEKTGAQCNYYQQLNVDGQYINDAYHPTQNNGKKVMCNQAMFNLLAPLVRSQPYINKFEVYKGQKIQVRLDNIRDENFVNMPYGAIQSWYAFAFPDMCWDISKAWMEVSHETKPLPKEAQGKILLNFTDRYRNPFINYAFLKKYEKHLLFIGTIDEMLNFSEMWDLQIPYLSIDDFNQLAWVMQNSRFLLGNQSFCWNLNRALNLPSILEMYQYAPNCIPFVGNKNYGFYAQRGLEYYFERLLNETA